MYDGKIAGHDDNDGDGDPDHGVSDDIVTEAEKEKDSKTYDKTLQVSDQCCILFAF